MLADSLNSNKASGYIKELTYKISDDLIMRLYGTFYSNLPIFLEEKDYKTISGFLQPDSLKNIINSDYKTLLSPSSVVFSKFIKKDPINLVPLALKKLQNLKFDENFDVNEGYIMTRDKKNLMMFISSSVSSTDNDRSKIFFDSLDEIIKSLNTKFNNKVTVEYYGASAVALGNARQIKNDHI